MTLLSQLDLIRLVLDVDDFVGLMLMVFGLLCLFSVVGCFCGLRFGTSFKAFCLDVRLRL